MWWELDFFYFFFSLELSPRQREADGSPAQQLFLETGATAENG